MPGASNVIVALRHMNLPEVCSPAGYPYLPFLLNDRTMKTLARAFRVYLFGLRLALRVIAAGLFLEGIKILMTPVGYWRFLPDAFALEEFQQKRQPRVLDLGSPKLLSLYLASRG